MQLRVFFSLDFLWQKFYQNLRPFYPLTAYFYIFSAANFNSHSVHVPLNCVSQLCTNPTSANMPTSRHSSKNEDIKIRIQFEERSSSRDVRTSRRRWYKTLFWRFRITALASTDRLCGLVVRVPGYRSRGHGFDSRRYQIFWEVVGLERGPLSLVRIIEELLEWKSSGSRSGKQRLTAVGIRCADHATLSIRKSWH
jgi:hypothetical protein